MKYLQNAFKDELNQGNLISLDDGIVKISGLTFQSLDILEVASHNKEKPTVYDQAFDAWRHDYVSEKIDKANSILIENEQLDRFLALQERYNKERLIPFVGAGLSYDTGYPLWRDFLMSLRRQTTLDELVLIQMLNKGEYEEAAELIANGMTPQLFSEALHRKYVISRSAIGAIQILPDVFDSHVITTNFDDLLREIYKSADKPFSSELLGYEAPNIRAALDDGSVLLKLHGHAERGKGRVLTKTEYETHYDGGKKLKELLGLYADRFSLLFLGCSLTVDRPIRALKEHIDLQGHEEMPRHYAFLEMPESDDVRVQREQDLSLHHIYPIWFPKDTHEESISALLLKLREERQ